MSQNQTNAFSGLRHRWQRLPIYVKLLVPLLVGLALTIALIIARVQAPIDALADSAVQQTVSRQLQSVTDHTQSFLEIAGDAVTSIGNSPAVSNFATAQLSRVTADINEAQWNLAIDLVDRATTANTPLSSILYLDQSGQVQALVTRDLVNGKVQVNRIDLSSPLVAQSNSPDFRQLIASPEGQAAILPVQLSKPAPNSGQQPEPLIQIGMPIYSGTTAMGAIVVTWQGAAILRDAFKPLETNNFSYALLQDNTEFLAVGNGSDRSVAVFGEPQVQQSALPTEALKPSDNRPVVEVNGRLYSTYLLKSQTVLPRNTWSIVVSEDRQAAYGDVNTLKTTILLTLIFVFVLISAGIIVISRSVMQPLTAVSAAAAQIAAGHSAAQIPIVAEDEIGRIANAVNTISHRLTESITTLERRVAQTTRHIDITPELTP